MTAKSMVVLLLVHLAMFSSSAVPQGREDVAVVVNADNRTTALTSAELRRIFTGEKRSWPGGAPIKLIVRSAGSHERLVLMKLLHMSEGDFKQHWVAQILRGEASSEPIVVPSVGMQKEALNTFPGAITLVNANELKPGMKVLKLDGRLPGEPEYSLH